MSNSILDLALSDFNLNIDKYKYLSYNDVDILTNNTIVMHPNNSCLSMSRQMLLDQKKTVTFSHNESPEYKIIINNEKLQYKKKRRTKKEKYNIPTLEYIDVCMANAALNNKRRKNKEKIKSNVKLL